MSKIRDPKRDASDDALSELNEKAGWMSRRGTLGASATAALGALLLVALALLRPGRRRSPPIVWGRRGRGDKGRSRRQP